MHPAQQFRKLIHKFTYKFYFLIYSISWEQRKVGELLIERNEQSPMNIEYPLMAFIANEGVAPKGERYDRSSLVTDTENKLYKRTEFGDFIYSSNNLETGSIGLNKYGKACISPVYSIFQPTGITDSDFLGRRLVRKDFINAMVKWRQGVIYGQWTIHESDFLKIEISVPSVKEQRKIGAYLDELDNLITLHQRKYDKLLSIKKSMLEKMFPRDGSKFPEIRFSGFTDPWEQRKLGDISESYSGGTPTAGKKEYYNGDIPFIRSGEIRGDKTELFITDEGLNNSSAKMVQIGYILYALYGATSGEVSISKLKGAINQAVLAIQPHQNYDSQFLMQWLRKSKDNIIGTYLQGGQGNLSGNIVKELIVDVPTYEEQKEIGAYFQQLDNLITLHQRKLEKLKNIKKSMLEKMFV